MNYIIGVDLSLTATGVVFLDDEKYLYTLIKTKPTRDNIGEIVRLRTIVSTVMAAISEWTPDEGPDAVVIEGVAFMARNTSALIQLAALQYMLRSALYEISNIHKHWNNLKPSFIIVPPTTLKKFITGKGNIAKEMMLLETYKKYDVSFDDNNLCDAYALSRFGQALLDESIETTKYQKEALSKIKPQL